MVANEFDGYFVFILFVPLAEALELLVALLAPRIWPWILSGWFTRTPKLLRIFQKMFADERFVGRTVLIALNGGRALRHRSPNV